MPTRQPSPNVDDAMIAFLDREDQTKSTLGDCLHTLALSSASDRVNNEALRRVFEQRAMTIFLLQFVARLRLTPAQLTEQKERFKEEPSTQNDSDGLYFGHYFFSVSAINLASSSFQMAA